MIQFKINYIESTFVFLKTCGNNLKFTFARGGYIIMIKPIAIGIFVRPILKLFINFGKDGIKYPMLIPMAMAINIHNVK